jgi:hypothetical protein
MKPLLALLFFALAAPAFAAGEDRPQDGAIQGGSIVPGERGGIPQSSPDRPSGKALERCRELKGKLREQCLLKERENSSAGASGTRKPEVMQPTPDTPPPQNPL